MRAVSETTANSVSPKEIHSPIVRWFAHAVSIIFHPLFIPVYITLFVLYVHPLLFAGYNDTMKLRLVGTVFVNLTMLPAITVLLSWRLKFISSIHMDTQKERIIPLAAAMIFYFWCWFVLKNFGEIPLVFRYFLLGCFITIIAGWLANIAFKVSLHALGMGGMFCFMFLLMFGAEGGSAQYFSVGVIIAGMVCSSRLIVSTHRPFDVYVGFLLGALSQVVALIV